MPSLSAIFAAVCGFLVLVILVLGIIVYVDGGKIDTLNGKISVCEATNKNFVSEIAVQDAAVDKLKTDEMIMIAAAATAEKQAAKDDADLLKQIDGLKVSKPTGDACAAANALFNSYIGGKK